MNGVAPGPIWTPLIPSTFPPEKVAKFGSDVPLEARRPAGGSRAVLRVPRVGRFELHDRAGPAPQRGRDRQRLESVNDERANCICVRDR